MRNRASCRRAARASSRPITLRRAWISETMLGGHRIVVSPRRQRQTRGLSRHSGSERIGRTARTRRGDPGTPVITAKPTPFGTCQAAGVTPYIATGTGSPWIHRWNNVGPNLRLCRRRQGSGLMPWRTSVIAHRRLGPSTANASPRRNRFLGIIKSVMGFRAVSLGAVGLDDVSERMDAG